MRFCSDPEEFTDGGRLTDYFSTFGISKWIYLDGTCSLFHKRNVTERRGGKEEREPESLLSAEFTQRLT